MKRFSLFAVLATTALASISLVEHHFTAALGQAFLVLVQALIYFAERRWEREELLRTFD